MPPMAPVVVSAPAKGKASAFPAALRDYCLNRVSEIFMAAAVLTISSKNYSSWSLRGWLMCKLAGLEVEERPRPTDDAAARAELLLLSPSFLVPALEHDGVTVWDTLSIADYLHEIRPEAGMLPADR